MLDISIQIEFAFDLQADDVKAIADEMIEDLRTHTLSTTVDASPIYDAVCPLVTAARQLTSKLLLQQKSADSIVNQFGSFASAVVAEALENETNRKNPSLQMLWAPMSPQQATITVPVPVPATSAAAAAVPIAQAVPLAPIPVAAQALPQQQMQLPKGLAGIPPLQLAQGVSQHQVPQGYIQMNGTTYGAYPMNYGQPFPPVPPITPNSSAYTTATFPTNSMPFSQMPITSSAPPANLVNGFDVNAFAQNLMLADEDDDLTDDQMLEMYKDDEEYIEMVNKYHEEQKRFVKGNFIRSGCYLLDLSVQS
jgi:hypothetical protein